MAKCGGDIAKTAELLGVSESYLSRQIRKNPILKKKWEKLEDSVCQSVVPEPRDPEEGIRRQIRLMEEELETGNFTHARRDKLRDTLARYHAILQRYEDQRQSKDRLEILKTNPNAFRGGFVPEPTRGPPPPRPRAVQLKLKSAVEIADLLKEPEE